MHTRIYIDGYNLYYGCLKSTPYKWLDLYKLFETYILPRSGSPASSISIKFFTADIQEKAAKDHNSVIDQRTYHQALRYHRKHEIEIIKGYYSINKATSYRVDADKDPRDCEKVNTWKLEEKQSDVNLSISALYDAMTDTSLEQIVFVTNDTDMAPALAKIKEFNEVLIQEGKRPPLKIGLVTPVSDNNDHRRPNKALDDLSEWTVKFIHTSELAQSQLPWKVKARKPAVRPISWFRHSEKVQYIYDSLLSVEKSPSKCWNWLSSKKPIVLDLPTISGFPIDLLDDDIDIVIKHVDAYCAYKKI